MNIYFGDVSLCYTNSVVMALDSFGFSYQPDFIEALMVMGNGASIIKDDTNHPLVLFDNGLPDRSICNCLRILGFKYDEYYLNELTIESHNDLRTELKRLLSIGPVVVGPIDMGYLDYNPNHNNLMGVDHFVTIFDFDETNIYLHDPAGFPFMKISYSTFMQAWKADKIEYKRGSYSMWGNFRQIYIPSKDDIYNETSQVIKKRYEYGEIGIISKYAKALYMYGMNKEQMQLNQYFSFKLSSIRSLYLSKFLNEHDSIRAKIKEKLAVKFAEAHIYSVMEDYEKLAETVEEISNLDEDFRKHSITYERK